MGNVLPCVNQLHVRYYRLLLAEIDEVYHEIALLQDLSDSAASLLYVLSANDGKCRLTPLIKESGLNKQTAYSAIKRLEEDGIVIRRRVDGRPSGVALTEKGFALAAETVDKVLAAEKRIYASWTREEWETYITLTERFLVQLRGEVNDITE